MYLPAENLTLQGRASQSSTAHDGQPSRAVDGKLSGYYPDRSCTHTNSEQRPWWQLSLDGQATVYKVRI